MEVVVETAGLLIDALPTLRRELADMRTQIVSMDTLLDAIERVSALNREPEKV